MKDLGGCIASVGCLIIAGGFGLGAILLILLPALLIVMEG